MSSKSKRKAKKGPSIGQRLQAVWPSGQLQLGPIQREAIGLVLLIFAILTLLSLAGVSSGAILGWWATALQRLFGWGAYLVALGLALAGIYLLWQDMRDRLPFDARAAVGLELLFLVILAASHMPLVLRSGVEAALEAAQLGQAGGHVGWALAVLLLEGLGVLIGALVLAAGLLLALFLVLPVSWDDLQYWVQRQYRLTSAALSRWRLARQGTAVAPEPEEVPWWEQEPDPSELGAKAKARKGASKRTSRKKKARPRTQPGSLPIAGSSGSGFTQGLWRHRRTSQIADH